MFVFFTILFLLNELNGEVVLSNRKVIVPVCPDGSKALSDAEKVLSCTGGCFIGFKCIYTDKNNIDGICCPDMGVLSEIYDENNYEHLHISYPDPKQLTQKDIESSFPVDKQWNHFSTASSKDDILGSSTTQLPTLINTLSSTPSLIKTKENSSERSLEKESFLHPNNIKSRIPLGLANIFRADSGSTSAPLIQTTNLLKIEEEPKHSVNIESDRISPIIESKTISPLGESKTMSPLIEKTALKTPLKFEAVKTHLSQQIDFELNNKSVNFNTLRRKPASNENFTFEIESSKDKNTGRFEVDHPNRNIEELQNKPFFCSRQPLSFTCHGGTKTTQFVTRWFEKDGMCNSYIFGYCAAGGTLQTDKTMRTEEDCKNYCLGGSGKKSSNILSNGRFINGKLLRDQNGPSINSETNKAYSPKLTSPVDTIWNKKDEHGGNLFDGNRSC
uniref:BPTI/Kunitz inhibitor domain-containing protein n=1 Tax=Rhabditophanes sp. KR3021 TaxID=114890 RepID=A0AC35UGP4_9BILA